MNKLQQIRELCDETIQDYKDVYGDEKVIMHDEFYLDEGRREFAEQVLEILNGEIK